MQRFLSGIAWEQIIINGNGFYPANYGWGGNSDAVTIQLDHGAFIVEASGWGGFYQYNTDLLGGRYDWKLNHKYYVFFDYIQPEFGLYYGLGNLGGSNVQGRLIDSTAVWKHEGHIFVCNATTKPAQIGWVLRGATSRVQFKIRNINCIDLTETYGEGLEPTEEQCAEIFKMPFYGFNIIKYYDAR